MLFVHLRCFLGYFVHIHSNEQHRKHIQKSLNKHKTSSYINLCIHLLAKILKYNTFFPINLSNLLQLLLLSTLKYFTEFLIFKDYIYTQGRAAKLVIFLNIIFVIFVNVDNNTRRRATILNKLSLIVLMHLCYVHIEDSFVVCKNILYSYVTCIFDFSSFAAPPCIHVYTYILLVPNGYD